MRYLISFLLLVMLGTIATAQEFTRKNDGEEPSTESLMNRLYEAERRLQRLEASQDQSPSSQWQELREELHREHPFEVGYDDGFYIRAIDKAEQPFELNVNGRLQMRHTGFARNIDEYSNRGDTFRGGPLPVFNRNDFELERARLVFSGFVHDPKLQFFINLDGDTDDQHRVIFHDFWFNYEFSEAFNLYLGKSFVPGSREWFDGSTRTHLADRSMGTTFFRPDRSIGVWAIGEYAEDLFYRVMVSNGFNTSDLQFSNLDTNMAYSGSTWWDVSGDYGQGYADLEWHEEPAVRIGNSFTYATQTGTNNLGAPRSEQNFIRLSDGTQLITPSALAPGVRVTGGNIYLYAIDFAFKYQGWSLNSEYYFRWLNEFRTTGGPIPYRELYDDGFTADVGYMIIRQQLEVVGRISNVDGLFGDRWEYAGGFNWYVDGTHKNKVTFDISHLDGSPVSNTGPNYTVGQDGLLTRLQWQIAF